MYEYGCTITKIVDGDTLHVEIDLGMDVKLNTVVRLHGVNSPEMNTPEGKAAKEWVTQRVSAFGSSGWIIQTIKDKKEKYGRYLGRLFFSDWCLNDVLVAAGHAVVYMETVK